MPLADDIRVTLVVADYAVADPIGKINMIGGAFQMVGAQNGVLGTPQSVVAIIDVPRKYAGDDCAVSLELRDDTSGQPVRLPGPAGTAEPLRVSQNLTINPPFNPVIAIPRDLPCRLQLALAIPPGLPVTPGHAYEWRFSIDGTHRKAWSTKFWVVAGPTQPVFGGPSGPADIPDVSL